MKRRILVTGGSGYVGSVLVPVLAQSYPVHVLETMAFGNPIEGTPNVTFFKGDIRNEADVKRALKGCTDVIHLAGIVTDELVDMNPSLARQVNVEAMGQLLGLARSASVGRFVYASSSSVYGSQDEVCTEATPPKPMTAYAQTKLDGETLLWKFQDAMTVVAVRSATCCGPAPRMRLDTIVNVFCKQAFFDGRITVFDGRQWRSNIHVRDVAACYETLLGADAALVGGQVFNVTRANHTALEIAEMVQARMGGEIEIDKTKEDQRNYRMDAAKIRRTLGWYPRYSLHDAVTDNEGFFASGGITAPDSDLYFNTRRMAKIMKGGA